MYIASKQDVYFHFKFLLNVLGVWANIGLSLSKEGDVDDLALDELSVDLLDLPLDLRRLFGDPVELTVYMVLDHEHDGLSWFALEDALDHGLFIISRAVGEAELRPLLDLHEDEVLLEVWHDILTK